MSETPPAKETLQACLGYMEGRLGINEVEKARHNASYRDTWNPRSTRYDRYQYGSLSSTFRGAFRHEAGVNPWGDIDWILHDDEYLEDVHPSHFENLALIYSAALTDRTPSSAATEALSLVASRVLSQYERKELYTQAAQERGLFRDEYWEEDRERVPSVGTGWRGEPTSTYR